MLLCFILFNLGVSSSNVATFGVGAVQVYNFKLQSRIHQIWFLTVVHSKPGSGDCGSNMVGG